MKNPTITIAALLSSILSFPLFADTETDFCNDYTLDEKYQLVFPSEANLAIGIVDQFCNGELSNPSLISNKILEISLLFEANFKVGTDFFFPITALNAKIQKALHENSYAPNMSQMPLAQGVGVKVESQPFNVSEEKMELCEQNAQKHHAASCRDYIGAYYEIYSYAQLLIQKLDTVAVMKFLNIAEQDWDDYYKKSRSQTLLERLVNSYFWRKDKKPGEFLRPPSTQYIVAHPSLIYENVSAAPDGSNAKEGLMLELFGMNKWRRDKWYQLSGASLVAVYSDRPVVQDWGYGAAFHFGNVYTFGAVNHGGDAGVFISLDILELFKDKKEYIDSYIGQLKRKRQELTQ